MEADRKAWENYFPLGNLPVHVPIVGRRVAFREGTSFLPELLGATEHSRAANPAAAFDARLLASLALRFGRVREPKQSLFSAESPHSALPYLV